MVGRSYGSGLSSKRGKGGRPIRMDMGGYEDWKCQQCGLGSFSTVMLRTGPAGERTLCNTCGLHWSIHNALPQERKDLFSFKDDGVDDSITNDSTSKPEDEDASTPAPEPEK